MKIVSGRVGCQEENASMLNATSDVKRCLVLWTAIFLSSGAVHAGQDHSSAKFTSKEGAFSVALPETPKEKSQEISSKTGPSTLHTFLVERNEGRSFFLVGYSDYQVPLDVKSSLEGVISGQVEGMKGKITSDKMVTLDGHPGRSVTIEAEGNVFFSSVYIVGNRLYQIMYGMPQAEAMPSDAREFFDSFRILL
ncbi:MAG TPA: hypothetical protein VIF64_03125 [Pyrinomonadaceae bacterium]|jgi:hypothetical protein